MGCAVAVLRVHPDTDDLIVCVVCTSRCRLTKVALGHPGPVACHEVLRCGVEMKRGMNLNVLDENPHEKRAGCNEWWCPDPEDITKCSLMPHFIPVLRPRANAEALIA